MRRVDCIPFTVSTAQKLQTHASGWIWNSNKNGFLLVLYSAALTQVKYILHLSWTPSGQIVATTINCWRHHRMINTAPLMWVLLPGRCRLCPIYFDKVSQREDPGLDTIGPSIVTLRYLYRWKSASMMPSFYFTGLPTANITTDQYRTVTKSASVNINYSHLELNLKTIRNHAYRLK